MSFSTIQQFVRAGLPAAALRQLPTTQAPVLHGGAGAGTVTPGGSLDVPGLLVAVLAVALRVAAGGAPGTATVQLSTDGGITYGPAVPTPATGPMPLGATGLAATFAGVFTAADVYSWTAATGVQDALDQARDEIEATLWDRYGGDQLAPGQPLFQAPYPPLGIRWECALAGLELLSNRGFNPENPADVAVKQRAELARAQLQRCAAGLPPVPRWVPTAAVPDTLPLSDDPRETMAPGDEDGDVGALWV